MGGWVGQKRAKKWDIICGWPPSRKMSAVVGWVNVKDWSIPHLKALTVTFKLM